MGEHKTLSDKSIKTQLSILNRDIAAEEKRHELEKAVLSYRKLVLQAYCAHHKTTYHPDPSGNSDSSYSCDVCGAEV